MYHCKRGTIQAPLSRIRLEYDAAFSWAVSRDTVVAATPKQARMHECAVSAQCTQILWDRMSSHTCTLWSLSKMGGSLVGGASSAMVPAVPTAVARRHTPIANHLYLQISPTSRPQLYRCINDEQQTVHAQCSTSGSKASVCAEAHLKT